MFLWYKGCRTQTCSQRFLIQLWLIIQHNTCYYLNVVALTPAIMHYQRREKWEGPKRTEHGSRNRGTGRALPNGGHSWVLGKGTVEVGTTSNSGALKEGRENTFSGASFKESLLKNLSWPQIPCEDVLSKGDCHVFSFSMDSIRLHLNKMRNFLVGRVVGDNPNPQALRLWRKKVWGIGEL